ncbi:class I SAM-dependent methyltransferase [Haloferax marisrubri]|uniref:Class I SAM-dependent methyltransferase n=1 Tax=Haloferax marisrubri TaxID=1544719 RepID=A0A2P4NKR2_9EURY|nr:class I SAM-dependent methyltransferase [Haloferax marisrubri]POG53721.1 class I SAM-dependent methyltransferase [Haloferax marisrubri]
MPNDGWNADYFDDEFDEPDPWDFDSSTYEQRKYRRQNRVVESHVGSPDSILEIGCAEGVHSELLLERFPDADLHGIDISEAAVERARERTDTDRATFFAGEASAYLDSLDEEFDVVVWSETIYYMGDTMSVPEFHRFLDVVAGLLAPDGVLCMANIVDQDEGPEAPLTEAPILDAYKTLLAARLDRVHEARYTESKPEDDAEHTYEVLGYVPSA